MTIHNSWESNSRDISHRPELICEYNKFMAGVDHNHQLLVYFAVGRKTVKWRERVFWRLVDISMVSCHLL